MIAGPRLERFESLDVLRGVAVLGIFAVNILAFGFPWYAISNPTVFPEYFNEAGRFWWMLSTGVFQFKFITLFSVMFGAGIVLMLGEEKPNPKIPTHRRRMFWLFVFGMLHNYLLWYGDILVPYAIAGFIVASARRWKTKTLVIAGAILVTLNFGLFFAQDLFFRSMPADALDKFVAGMWAPPRGQIEEELAAFRSGFLERAQLTAFDSLMSQFMQGVFLSTRTIGVMMFGMALYKSGFLTLRWSRTAYLVVGLIGAGAGLAGSFGAAQQSIDAGFDMIKVFSGHAALYWASLVQAFGYAALVMWVSTFPLLKLIRAPFAAAGRMALSNYLASTFIGIGIFYGPPGLGKIGTMSFPELAIIVAGVWAFILVWSPIWLAFFRFGPFEWLWRTLTYGRVPPMIR